MNIYKIKNQEAVLAVVRAKSEKLALSKAIALVDDTDMLCKDCVLYKDVWVEAMPIKLKRKCAIGRYTSKSYLSDGYSEWFDFVDDSKNVDLMEFCWFQFIKSEGLLK